MSKDKAEEKTDLQKILNSQWYLLEQPWCHSSNAGTAILAGSPDPHIGLFVADTEMMQDDIEEGQPRAIAQHIADLHNAEQSKLQALRDRLRKTTLSMKAHPDYQTGRNQEFIDMVDMNEELLINLNE